MFKVLQEMAVVCTVTSQKNQEGTATSAKRVTPLILIYRVESWEQNGKSVKDSRRDL